MPEPGNTDEENRRTATAGYATRFNALIKKSRNPLANPHCAVRAVMTGLTAARRLDGDDIDFIQHHHRIDRALATARMRAGYTKSDQLFNNRRSTVCRIPPLR
jgi:hypothetical protein